MRLLLARHGQTDHNLQRRYQGQIDTALNQAGLEQTEKLAARLAAERIDAIYSSDLRRSLQTAEMIAHGHALKVIRDARLREMSFGEWEGYTHDEVQAQAPALVSEWIKDPVNVAPPRGETVRELAARVQAGLDEVRRAHAAETVVFVTHGGVIRTLLCLGLGIELDHQSQFDTSTGSLSEISFYGETAVVNLFNGTSHL